MDGLFAAHDRRPVLLSSTDIPDNTKVVRVGADDMLINAINQMTRRSESYVFLDQAIVWLGGELDLRVVAKDDPPRPDFYIRGSISQLDRDAVNDSTTIGGRDSTNTTTGLTGLRYRGGQKLSVVSVDLHLVGYPSRRVIPGLSVANSMIVVSHRRNLTASGIISMTGLDLSLQINRVESIGQAVRNLIELGVIELLGRHSGVPYWTCLSTPETDPLINSSGERAFVQLSESEKITETQQALSMLDYLGQGYIAGVLDHQTRNALARYQADEQLIASGTIDYDVLQSLRRQVLQQQTVEQESHARPTEISPPARQTQPAEARSEDGYLPLHLILDLEAP